MQIWIMKEHFEGCFYVTGMYPGEVLPMKRTISFRPYIIIIALVVVVFIVSNYFLVRSIEDTFFDFLETQYINHATVFSHDLTKAAEAYLITNDMLERRILSSIRTVALYSDQVSNEALVDLADTLAVDDIFLYSPNGRIDYSSRPEYLGWLANPGHPVHDFMVSGLTVYVEDIRPDSESGEYYKYGYLRLEDGRFIQLGVHANLIENFLAPFEVERLLNEISAFDIVDHVYYVHPDFSVSGCCDTETVGFQLDNPQVLEAIETRTTFSWRRQVEGQNREIYEIFTPIFVGDSFGGTLVVAKTTDEADAIVRTAIILSLAVSTIVFASLIYIMLSNYRHSKRLVSLAYSDALTGLPNNAHLLETLTEALSQNFQYKQAIVMIHCQNLGMISSTYGLSAGERVIKALADKLADFTSDTRRLFRFDVSRFVLYISEYRTKAELEHLAESLLDKLVPSMEIVGRPIEVRMGLVMLSPTDQAIDVLTQATMVMHHLDVTKSSNRYAFFDAEIEKQLQREETIAHEMAEFLADRQQGTFHLEYQPKVDLTSNKIIGFEALSRMTSPTLGRVSPLEFICIAERQEMIVPLGYWALETACQFIKELKAEGFSDLYVAVNISVVQLLQEDFPKKAEEIVTRAGIDPCSLQLEITESVLIEDFDDIQAKLQSLRDLGLTIALDDFGTGYSTLSRMGELAVDVIKIDKSFIDKILVDDSHRQIIDELIAMCHKLDLPVVAEGVETERQREYLRNVGCDIMQGYLFSKPLPEDLALKKLKENVSHSGQGFSEN